MCGSSKSVSLLHGEYFVWQGTVNVIQISSLPVCAGNKVSVLPIMFHAYFQFVFSHGLDDLLFRVSSKQIYVYCSLF